MNFPVHQSTNELWFPKGDVGVARRLVQILDVTLQDVYKGREALEDQGEEPAGLNVAGVPLDDALPPLLVVLTSIVKGNENAKQAVKEKVVPDDIDRSKHLSEGSTVTARLIKFMTSVSLLNVKETASELLFELFDRDASALTQYVGYGNAAGFLFNRGLLPQGVPEEHTSAAGSSSSNPPINPVTGEYARDMANEEWDKLTDEEKEREAEKLFVLFERLNRTGVIKVQLERGDEGGSGEGGEIGEV
ncbi:hypothetical protein HDV00_009983 [Rhizophlyctis rosea]|nr:hypothetical protein HDV00_009983 [Rhizophlyctis rosea]